MNSIDKPEREQILLRLADGIAANFKAVAFDMDQCVVASHSRGKLSREELPSYLAKITPDFVDLVPLLISRGVKLSIATHSDSAEYSGSVAPSTHIMGEELARSVLANAVPSLAEHFGIVAYNPYVRHHALLFLMPNMLAKKHHIREVRSK